MTDTERWPFLKWSPYEWSDLIDHLLRSGNGKYAVAAVAILLDVQYIYLKLQRLGPSALELDFRRLLSAPGGSARFQRNVASAREVFEAFTACSHLLHRDPRQIRTQLYGRLLKTRQKRTMAFLQALRSRRGPWLRALCQTMASPSEPLVRTLRANIDSINAIAVGSSGVVAASGGKDGIVRIWSLESGDLVCEGCRHAGPVRSLAFADEGRFLLSASEDRSIRTWDTQTNCEVWRVNDYRGPPETVSAAQDRPISVVAWPDGTLRIWDLRTGKLRRKKVGADGGSVTALAVSRDAKWVASALDDESIRLWDLETGREEWRTREPGFRAHALCLFAGGSRLAVALYARLTMTAVTKVWDLERKKLLCILRGHRTTVVDVAACSDARILATASWDRTVRVWNVETGRELRCLDGDVTAFRAVAVTPDGRYAVSGSEDGSMGLWDLSRRRRQIIPKGHTSSVTAIDILMNSGWTVSASQDRSIKVWETATGRQIAVARQDRLGSVEDLAVTADEQKILCITSDYALETWSIPDAELLQYVRLPGSVGQAGCPKCIAASPEPGLFTSPLLSQ